MKLSWSMPSPKPRSRGQLATNSASGQYLYMPPKAGSYRQGTRLNIRETTKDPGTTHAEQCCFIKIADEHNLPEERIHEVLPPDTVLYTTMEPCNERLSGNMTCAARILRLKGAIKAVYVGIREPGTFIANSDGQERLEANGVKVLYPVEHWRDRITEISMAGH
ncbi:hypothetical protein H9Q69_004985 [Fusarium xylarioides]|uniref:CMP/dCMP-type deaminase domain-containing protein n=1 Tax=Fusarium xylarioides TaxID=221167 RepID=A0A9P7IRT0_9HYPO|nr:hypothetical protein H9Q70_004315 [Fusarium xylarioides]KAG5771286.1 hypothetical protein H9Q72_002108 [Fusarium xylarioides]KAG5781922.1 hypothetical protein H9Q73_004419 [Fusarium xylarioides]KAG5795973.1 hypothetical protein H9Q69_004985 [Fusarium xylarioides]KAG5815834.1 hypothetical protein H9Q71_002601 [Fusarium xylarioides]